MSLWPKDWKIRLRYNKLTTPFNHYTLIADVTVGEIDDNYNCPPGNAFVALKVWAESDDQAVDILEQEGIDIGFTIKNKVQIYYTDPEQPPGESPIVYSINFTPYVK